MLHAGTASWTAACAGIAGVSTCCLASHMALPPLPPPCCTTASQHDPCKHGRDEGHKSSIRSSSTQGRVGWRKDCVVILVIPSAHTERLSKPQHRSGCALQRTDTSISSVHLQLERPRLSCASAAPAAPGALRHRSNSAEPACGHAASRSVASCSGPQASPQRL